MTTHPTFEFVLAGERCVCPCVSSRVSCCPPKSELNMLVRHIFGECSIAHVQAPPPLWINNFKYRHIENAFVYHVFGWGRLRGGRLLHDAIAPYCPTRPGIALDTSTSTWKRKLEPVDCCCYAPVSIHQYACGM